MKLLSSNTLSTIIHTRLPQIVLIAIFTTTHTVCGICCMNSNINHDISKIQSSDTNRYYRKQWNKLIPSYSKIQIAGGIGRVAIGPGWDYGRKSQWETDFLIGYLPKYKSKYWKITLTLKQNYIPWQIPLGNTPLTFSPLSCGIYGCLLIGGGENFWIKEPPRYPDRSYYRFPTRIRGHIFLGERFTLNIKHGMSRTHKSIAFYYEICTHDLALISLCTNKYLSLKDALSLAFGVKLQLF